MATRVIGKDADQRAAQMSAASSAPATPQDKSSGDTAHMRVLIQEWTNEATGEKTMSACMDTRGMNLQNVDYANLNKTDLDAVGQSFKDPIAKTADGKRERDNNIRNKMPIDEKGNCAGYANNLPKALDAIQGNKRTKDFVCETKVAYPGKDGKSGDVYSVRAVYADVDVKSTTDKNGLTTRSIAKINSVEPTNEEMFGKQLDEIGAMKQGIQAGARAAAENRGKAATAGKNGEDISEDRRAQYRGGIGDRLVRTTVKVMTGKELEGEAADKAYKKLPDDVQKASTGNFNDLNSINKSYVAGRNAGNDIAKAFKGDSERYSAKVANNKALETIEKSLGKDGATRDSLSAQDLNARLEKVQAKSKSPAPLTDKEISPFEK